MDDHARSHRNQGLKNIRAAVGGVCSPLGATVEDNGDQVGQISDVLFRIEAKDGRRMEVTFYLVDIQDSYEKIVQRAERAISDIGDELKRSGARSMGLDPKLFRSKTPPKSTRPKGPRSTRKSSR
jgi:hypothetical protein